MNAPFFWGGPLIPQPVGLTIHLERVSDGFMVTVPGAPPCKVVYEHWRNYFSALVAGHGGKVVVTGCTDFELEGHIPRLSSPWPRRSPHA